MTRRLSRDAIAAALAARAEGKTQADVARSLGVHVSTVRRWEQDARPAQAPAPAPPPEPEGIPPLPPEPAPSPLSAERLAQAFTSAGFAPDPSLPAFSSPDPEPEPEHAAPPPPSPAELVGFVELVLGILVRVQSSVLRADLSDDELGKIAALAEHERAGLELLAPYAVQRVPAWLDKIPDLAALGFGALIAWSAYARIKAVSELARERRATSAEISTEEHEERPWNYQPGGAGR